MYFYTISYLVGLVICSIATGVLTSTAPYGFLVLGIGLMVYALFVQVVTPIIKRITR